MSHAMRVNKTITPANQIAMPLHSSICMAVVLLLFHLQIQEHINFNLNKPQPSVAQDV